MKYVLAGYVCVRVGDLSLLQNTMQIRKLSFVLLRRTSHWWLGSVVEIYFQILSFVFVRQNDFMTEQKSLLGQKLQRIWMIVWGILEMLDYKWMH